MGLALRGASETADRLAEPGEAAATDGKNGALYKRLQELADLGGVTPPELGLDFALPIAFIAMLGPAMRTGAHRIAALVGGTGALLFAFMPWNLGLICGAVLGMMAGAEVERRQSLRVREETTEDAMTTGETR